MIKVIVLCFLTSYSCLANSTFKIETINSLKKKETHIIHASNEKIIINKVSYSMMLFYSEPRFWSKLLTFTKETNRMRCSAGKYSFEVLKEGEKKQRYIGCMEDREFNDLRKELLVFLAKI